MGLDFTKRGAPSWNRGWDKGKDELERHTLFTSQNMNVDQTFRAKPMDGVKFEANMEVVLTISGDAIRITHLTQTIGMSMKPSQSLLEAIATSGSGMAVGKIEKIAPLTGSAEVRVIH